MKKFILIITALLLVTGNAYAYGPINKGYVVLETGLSDLLVEPQTEDGWATYFISIKGENLGYFETGNASLVFKTDHEIRLKPISDYLVKENGYAPWKISGKYDEQFFIIGGLTLEGDLLHNKIVPHGFGLFIGLLVLLFAKMVWLDKRSAR